MGSSYFIAVPDTIKPKVLIAVPNTGWVHQDLVCQLIAYSTDDRVDKSILLNEARPTELNRNKIWRYFCKNDFDYLITIDADNPPHRTPIDLIFMGKDIIGCPTPLLKGLSSSGKPTIVWNAFDLVPGQQACREHRPCIGLQKVDAIGTGCVVISKKVVRALEGCKAVFAAKWNEDRSSSILGHDLSFCQLCREHDIEIWCHYDYPCHHFKEVNLWEIAQELRSSDNPAVISCHE